MRNFFMNKFNEVCSLDDIRQEPFTNDELKEVLPFQEDRREYLRLFKELYEEALLFQCHPNLHLIKHTYNNEIKKKYKDLLDFCLLKNLFDYDVYKDFEGDKKEWEKHFFPMSHLTVNVFRYPEFKTAYVIETLDEYRLRIEEYFAQLDNWYLQIRYDVCECFDTKNDEYISKLYKYDDFTECSFDEVKSLFTIIKKDLDKCEQSIKEMSKLIPHDLDDGFFYKYYEWFEIRKKLDYEQKKLEHCLSVVEERLNTLSEYNSSGNTDNESIIVPQFEQNTILYIYFGDIKCHKNNHSLIQATAIVSGRNGTNIELNVEYCEDCNKYLLRYQSFEEYRKKYGLIIGNFREVYNGNFEGDYDLALESPLKLSGYSVGQKESLRQTERHYILATIIHNGIMSKGEVIRYLNYFIKMQGAKTSNEIAVSKWKDDLMFVQEYNKSIQPKVYISEMKKY